MIIRDKDDAIAIKREIDEKVYDIQLEDTELEEIHQIIMREDIEDELYSFVEEDLTEEEAQTIKDEMITYGGVEDLISRCIQELNKIEEPIKKVIFENELRKMIHK